MRILFVSHSSIIQSYREKLRLLCKSKSVDLTLLVPKIWPEAGQRVRSESQPPEKEGFRIISAPIVFEGRIKRHFYPFFYRYVQQIRPDIIHVEEEPYSLVAWQAARAARKLGAKLIFFTWENLLERFEFPHQHIRDFVLKSAHHAIAGNREAGQLLVKAGYPSDRISIIPQYGVNPKLFQKKNSGLLKKRLGLGKFTVGYVGRLVPEKGIHHLLEAFARFSRPGSNLLIVGTGPMGQSLQEQAGTLGIAEKTRFIPAMAQNLLPDYLNCMDVLVLPSLTTTRWKEQFGRVLIEAQACEVPVIGSDSGAIPEVISKAGLIFPEGNVFYLTAVLKKLASSPALKKSLGRKGRKRVLELYTNHKIAERIYDLYQFLPGGKKP